MCKLGLRTRVGAEVNENVTERLTSHHAARVAPADTHSHARGPLLTASRVPDEEDSAGSLTGCL